MKILIYEYWLFCIYSDIGLILGYLDSCKDIYWDIEVNYFLIILDLRGFGGSGFFKLYWFFL